MIIHNYHQNSIASSSLIPILVFSSPHRFATCRYEGNLNSILFTPVYCFTSTNRTRLVKAVKHPMLFRLLATEPQLNRKSIEFDPICPNTHCTQTHAHTLSFSFLHTLHHIAFLFYWVLALTRGTLPNLVASCVPAGFPHVFDVF